MKLTWTTQQPATDGYYWHRCEDEEISAGVVEVGRTLFWEPGMEEARRTTEGTGHEWAGPLAEPMEPEYKPCLLCGNMTAIDHRHTRAHRKYCSDRCRHKAYRMRKATP